MIKQSTTYRKSFIKGKSQKELMSDVTATLSDFHFICGKWSARIPHQWPHSINDCIRVLKNPVVYRLQSSYKTNPEPINMFFCQKLLFTVTCLAVVALIHMMTVQFYFHDTTTAVTKLHVKQRMFGKCKPQISRMLRKTITQGTRRKNKQKRSV